ncbi:MAG TPA: hypothetical protein VFQ34_10800 [Nitrospiraceae bacterium]|nr:hypothetical protein [Nitrospiraceae bacterium]
MPTKSQLRRWVATCALSYLGLVGGLPPADAIEVTPTDEQIKAVIDRGKAAAEQRLSPDQLHRGFGSADDLKPRGFIMTKLGSLLIMANHLSLRAQVPGDQDVAQVLANPNLLINVMIYGDRLNFAADTYVLLEQNGRSIKPVNVRFDARADRTSVWPQQPAYRAKVIALFPYADIDPRAKTRLTVFPSGGGEVSFDLDFSEID